MKIFTQFSASACTRRKWSMNAKSWEWNQFAITHRTAKTIAKHSTLDKTITSHTNCFTELLVLVPLLEKQAKALADWAKYTDRVLRAELQQNSADDSPMWWRGQCGHARTYITAWSAARELETNKSYDVQMKWQFIVSETYFWFDFSCLTASIRVTIQFLSRGGLISQVSLTQLQ